RVSCRSLLFFLSVPPRPGFSPLSLHDALPIFAAGGSHGGIVDGVRPERVPAGLGVLLAHRDPDVGRQDVGAGGGLGRVARHEDLDRKSTRLNSSHVKISYAVFCLKKKTKT